MPRKTGTPSTGGRKPGSLTLSATFFEWAETENAPLLASAIAEIRAGAERFADAKSDIAKRAAQTRRDDERNKRLADKSPEELKRALERAEATAKAIRERLATA